MTVEEVATAFKLSPKTIRRWLREGKFPRAHLLSRQAGWRVPRIEVDKVLKGSGLPPLSSDQ